MQHRSRCHCGALRCEFETSRSLAPRACQCGFCRRHGARTVTDPGGSAVMRLRPDAVRYRFGTGTTDFILCGRCGVYIGALTEADGRTLVTLNLNAFDDPRLDLEATPAWYDGESAAAKAERRRRKWTPAQLA